MHQNLQKQQLEQRQGGIKPNLNYLLWLLTPTQEKSEPNLSTFQIKFIQFDQFFVPCKERRII